MKKIKKNLFLCASLLTARFYSAQAPSAGTPAPTPPVPTASVPSTPVPSTSVPGTPAQTTATPTPSASTPVQPPAPPVETPPSTPVPSTPAPVENMTVAATPAETAPAALPAEVATIATLKTAFDAYIKETEPLVKKIDTLLLNNAATLPDIQDAETAYQTFVTGNASFKELAQNEKTFDGLTAPARAELKELVDKSKATSQKLQKYERDIATKKTTLANDLFIKDYNKKLGELIAQATALNSYNTEEQIQKVVHDIEAFQKDFDTKVETLKKSAPKTANVSQLDRLKTELKKQRERITDIKIVKK